MRVRRLTGHDRVLVRLGDLAGAQLGDRRRRRRLVVGARKCSQRVLLLGLRGELGVHRLEVVALPGVDEALGRGRVGLDRDHDPAGEGQRATTTSGAARVRRGDGAPPQRRQRSIRLDPCRSLALRVPPRSICDPMIMREKVVAFPLDHEPRRRRHRPLRDRARRDRLRAGADRERAAAGAASSAAPRSAPGSGRRCSPTAPSRTTRRWSRCSPGCCSAPSSRSPSTGSARRLRGARSARARRASLDGIGGRAAARRRSALLLAWGFGAVALHATGDRRATCARRCSARRSSARSTTRCRPRARCSTCCAGSTRRRRCAAPTPTSRRPTAPSLDDPDVRAAGRLDRARARHRLRARGRGLGLGRRRPGLVVTNAHVVAGEDDTTVSVEGGPELDATAVHYDPRNDLALLAVAGLDAPPLALADDRGEGRRRAR